MRRILYLILFTGFSFTIAAQTPIESISVSFLDSDSKIVLVAAHRAAHQKYPENSLPAIEEAIRLGVDIVELDVKVTRDGIPVLMHDRTIDRTTNGRGKPSDYTLQELRNFKLLHEGEVTEEDIPTFEEALKYTKGKVLIDIDIKTDRLDPIIEVIQRLGAVNQVFWFDSDYEALEHVRAADKDFMLMPRAYSLEMADSAIARFQPEVIHIDFSFYTEEVVRLIKSNGARIWINALGTPDLAFGTEKEGEALDNLLKNGANIIQTDQPQLLLIALRKRGIHP